MYMQKQLKTSILSRMVKSFLILVYFNLPATVLLPGVFVDGVNFHVSFIDVSCNPFHLVLYNCP
jgi:hypothetical protein